MCRQSWPLGLCHSSHQAWGGELPCPGSAPVHTGRVEVARLVDAVVRSPSMHDPASGSAHGRAKTHWSCVLTKVWERRLTFLSCYMCICKGRAAVRHTSGCELPGPAHPGCQSMSNVQATCNALWQLVRITASESKGKSCEALLPSPAAHRTGAAQLG